MAAYQIVRHNPSGDIYAIEVTPDLGGVITGYCGPLLRSEWAEAARGDCNFEPVDPEEDQDFLAALEDYGWKSALGIAPAKQLAEESAS